jgi:DNA invertase Pin-like site-specific DNA recombinase
MAGRKPIEINLAEVERLAGLGLTEAEICTSLGISQRTLERRKAESGIFGEALKKGKTATQVVVANKLVELCKKGNLGAIIWWEKTRLGYSETIKQEQTINESGVRVYLPDNGRNRDQTTAGATGDVSK